MKLKIYWLISLLIILSACDINKEGYKTCIIYKEPFVINYHFKYLNNKIMSLKIETQINKGVFKNNQSLMQEYLKDLNYQIADDVIYIYEDVDTSEEDYDLDKTLKYYQALGSNCF